tara:strand:- start:3 stop:434 length:432 start_codon:yes stop_codon:yes gene_type:complete
VLENLNLSCKGGIARVSTGRSVRQTVSREETRKSTSKEERRARKTKSVRFRHRGGQKTRETKKRASSLSPLDVQSALTDAAAVSLGDSVDVCRRITAKVRAAKTRDRAKRLAKREGEKEEKKRVSDAPYSPAAGGRNRAPSRA